MFRSILVPVDGSLMAEQAVVPAAETARRLGAALALATVHPWGPTEDAPVGGSARDRAMHAEEVEYLDRLRGRIAAAFGIDVTWRVLEGDPAPALIDFARELGVDLLITSTRGRGTFLRTFQGDLTLRLAHGLACPTLFLKPRARDQVVAPPAGFRRIVVALDGSRASEAGIEPALALADRSQVRLSLVRVVSPLGTGGPERRREALAYLARVAARLGARGIAAETRVLSRVDAARAVLDHARHTEADLVALATRERGAVRRFALGSTADALVHRGFVPTLVCHSVADEAVRDRSWGDRAAAGMVR